MKFLSGFLLILLGGLFNSQAKDHTLNDFKLGNYVIGDESKLNDLKGKVVVIEFWGVKCPPCLAKMPHLVTLDKQYSDQGLRLIGAEMQRSNTSRIQSALKRSGATFPIVQGCQNPIGVNSLPHMTIFDVDGKLVYSGYPNSETDNIILKQLERVSQLPTVNQEPSVNKMPSVNQVPTVHKVPTINKREIRIRPILPSAG